MTLSVTGMFLMSKEVEDSYKSNFKPEIELLEGKLKTRIL